jgi:acetyl esterase/lipase
VSEDILTLAPPAHDLRIQYGEAPQHFADVRFPKSRGPAPAIINIHGGFWRAKYNLAHAGHLCAALAGHGFVTVNVEYRRVGDPGGGWPGTFEDLRRAFQFVVQHAHELRSDAAKLTVMGHSAGGQLALCLAAHEARVARAVSLAGVLDLRRAWQLHLSHDAVVEFLGGTPEQVSEHYKEASPAELAIRTAQTILHGTKDDTVPVEMSREYVRQKKSRGERVKYLEIPEADHYNLIDPRSKAFQVLISEF